MLRLLTSLVLLLYNTTSNGQDMMRILCSSPSDTTCPPQCRKDLSHHYYLIKYTKLPQSTAGMYLGPPIITYTKQILINSEMKEAYIIAAKHHEACHEEMLITTGKPTYHP